MHHRSKRLTGAPFVSVWTAIVAACLLAWGVTAYFVGKGLVAIVRALMSL